MLDLRLCGAVTQALLGAQTKVLINGQPPALEGDVDSDNMLGALQSILGSNVLIGGIPAIAAIADMAQTDVRGIIPHVTGFPIPITGSPNVMIGQGSLGAGLGMMLGAGGALQIGELVSIGTQIVGQVLRFVNIGGRGAVTTLSNLQGQPISPGQTLTGQTSGNSFTYSFYVDSRVYDPTSNVYPSVDSVSANAVVNAVDYVTVQSYFDYPPPSSNLTASIVTDP